MRAALVVVLALALPRAARADCAEQPGPAGDKGWPLLASVAPFYASHCVPGEVVAVIAAYQGMLTEPQVDRAYAIEKQGDGPYQLTLPGDAPHVLLVAAPDEPNPYRIEDQDGKPVERKAVRLMYSARAGAGLTADAHLVRLRVNDGRGERPRWEVFVDKPLVLDGTPEFPAKLSPLLHATLAPYESARSKEGKRWRAQLRAANAAAMKAGSFDGSGYWPKDRGEEVAAGYRVEWVPDRKLVRITFYARLSATFTKKVKTPRPPMNGPCLLNSDDCVTPPMPPAEPYTFETLAYSSEYAVIIDVDGTGKVTGSRELPVSSPPPATSTRHPS